MLTLTSGIQPVKTETTIVVPDDYVTIQEAVNNANDGDIIFVRNAVYHENVVINKSVALVGEDKCNTIIDGNRTGYVICVEGKWFDPPINNAQIVNFTLQNGIYGVGLIGAHYTLVKNNNILNMSEDGICLSHSDFVQISDNVISGSIGGIMLWSGSCYNKIINNTMKGGWLALCDYCFHNVAIGNKISDVEEAIYLRSGGYAIYAINNTFAENIIANCSVAVYLDEEWGGRCAFYHNNFINNTQQVVIGFKGYSVNNTLDDGYPSGGNYWSDYAGADLFSGPYQNETGSDGIGDTPYIIDKSNQDNYPLTNPWSPLPPIPGDVNSDGTVDISDIILWASAFGSRPGDPNWSIAADLAKDTVIDIFDAILIAVNFGKTYP